MKLCNVLVQTFRSIVHSGAVDIDDSVTVLIGKNEQGKTTFLRGIRAFNQDQTFSPGDLPNHLRPALEDRPAGDIPMVTLTFSVEPPDRKRLASIAIGIDAAAWLKCTKYYDNGYKFWLIESDGKETPLQLAPPDITSSLAKIKQTLDNLKTKLRAHGQRIPAFAANQDKIEQIVSAILTADFRDSAQIDNIVKTFTTSLKALTGQDQPILDDIAAATKEIEVAAAAIQTAHQQDPAHALKQALPTFILHSTKADLLCH